MFVAALFWAVGFVVAALGISTGQLWLVYLGYGGIGGIGLGIGYISPVSTLIKWFPDRPGLATGMAIMGFGGGALIASPLSGRLLALYDPSYDSTDPTSIASGHAVTMLFVTLGIVYFCFMMFGAFTVRVPADDWKPEGFDPSQVGREVDGDHATASRRGNAIRTPQFWLLWIVLFCNVTAGIGILEQAAPMIQDFFREGTHVQRHRRRGGWLRRPAVDRQHGAAGSSGPRPPTSSGASRSTCSTSAAAWCSTCCWRSSGPPRRRCSCCWPR